MHLNNDDCWKALITDLIARNAGSPKRDLGEGRHLFQMISRFRLINSVAAPKYSMHSMDDGVVMQSADRKFGVRPALCHALLGRTWTPGPLEGD